MIHCSSQRNPGREREQVPGTDLAADCALPDHRLRPRPQEPAPRLAEEVPTGEGNQQPHY